MAFFKSKSGSYYLNGITAGSSVGDDREVHAYVIPNLKLKSYFLFLKSTLVFTVITFCVSIFYFLKNKFDVSFEELSIVACLNGLVIFSLTLRNLTLKVDKILLKVEDMDVKHSRILYIIFLLVFTNMAFIFITPNWGGSWVGGFLFIIFALLSVLSLQRWRRIGNLRRDI